MRLIDAHINLTRDGRWYHTAFDASVDTALRQMDRAGVEMAGIVPTTQPENRAFALEVAAKHSDRFYTGFTLQGLGDDELAALRDCLDDGVARFVKVHPRTSGILPRDPRLDPFLAEAEARGIPVLFCGYMRGSTLPIAELQPLVYDEIARRRPELRLVITHAGSYRPLDALAVGQSHENVHLDFSHVFEYFAGSSVAADLLFTVNRLDRRSIYGSDFPEYPIDLYAEKVRRLTEGLEGFDAQAFFAGNAARLYRV
jgi:predicted TIM-barrel fold metal-dependent hydrolase